METMLTPDEVAAMLKIPKSWLYGRIHSKTLPFAMVKVGHYVRFPESGVRAFVEAETKPANGQNGNGKDSRKA